MARNRAPITKQSRREGYALHPKAHRIMVKKATPPGQHGRNRQSRGSQYSQQLREKQKVKRLYGLLEKQFRRIYGEAVKDSEPTGVALMRMLEQRVDNAVYRAGFAPSRQAARQLVSHGHLTLNGKRVNIPSILLSPGDEVVVRDKSKKNQFFSNLDDLTANVEQPSLGWLKSNRKSLSFKITGVPQREEAEPDINEQLIIEYYSR